MRLSSVQGQDSCAPIRIIRPRRQIQSSSVDPTSSLSAVLLELDILLSPDPSWRRSSGRPGTTWLDHIQWRRSQVKSGGINIEKIEGVGSGEGLCPPQLGVWGLAPRKKLILR